MPSSWEKVKVGDSNVRVYQSVPENRRPAGALVVVQGQTGVNDMVQFSDLAAQNGFIAAAPDLYHRDPPDCKDDWPTRRMRLTGSMVITDIDATVDFLKSHNSSGFAWAVVRFISCAP
jgi:dienelactone hydrolase